jgi:uncharacterized protein (TIGR02328 family)
MRLWHEKLLPYLPTPQFNGQHRECCALRGAGWDKKHSTVDYIFTHPIWYLAEYHHRYLALRDARKYSYDSCWLNSRYRGKNCSWVKEQEGSCLYRTRDIIYPEHDDKYLVECVYLLSKKMREKPHLYRKLDRERLLQGILNLNIDKTLFNIIISYFHKGE